MLKKLFLGIIALCFILFGGLFVLLGYVFNNPDKIFSAFTTMTEKFTQGQAYEEEEEFFLQGITSLSISSHRTDFKIKTYAGSTLKISLQGKIPGFESGPFIIQEPTSSTLSLSIKEPMASQWVQMTVNGKELTQESNARLQASIYIPETFKGQQVYKNSKGSVTLMLNPEAVYELDLKSSSGVISNTLNQKPTSGVKPEEVGSIEIETQQGPISVEPY